MGAQHNDSTRKKEREARKAEKRLARQRARLQRQDGGRPPGRR
jgi:hypothetical protein